MDVLGLSWVWETRVRRLITPVLSTVLLVAVVAVLGATTAVGALAITDEIDRDWTSTR
jgi:FlaG/FlaF family flagellin (archaellin)